MAKPIPLEAPVTMAARSGMADGRAHYIAAPCSGCSRLAHWSCSRSSSPGAAARTRTAAARPARTSPRRRPPRRSSSRAATTRRSARCAPSGPRRRCSRRASGRCASATTASGSRCSTSRASRSRPTPSRSTSPSRTGPGCAGRSRRTERVAARQAAVPVAPDAGRPRRRRHASGSRTSTSRGAGATSSPRSRSSTARWSPRRSSRCAPAPGGPPDVGDSAIKVDTDTPQDVGGDIAAIDTRIPPLPELHETNFADVLGKKPVVLAFATPQLCQTRVCGPVVDVVAEVRAQNEDVEFIAQEIYVDNDINKGFRPQVGEWRLPTEPWTFVDRPRRQGRRALRGRGVGARAAGRG